MSDIQISRYEITRFVTVYINAKTTFENIDRKSILFSTKYYSEETQMNKTWKIYFFKKQLEFLNYWNIIKILFFFPLAFWFGLAKKKWQEDTALQHLSVWILYC